MTKDQLGRPLSATAEMRAMFPHYHHDTEHGGYVSNSHDADLDIFVTRYEHGYHMEMGTTGKFESVYFDTWGEVVAFYLALCLEHGDKVR